MSFQVPRFTADQPQRLSVACIQLASDDDAVANVARAELGVREAAARGARLIALPEKWNVIGGADVLQAGAEAEDGPTLTKVRDWAQELDCWILAGSMVIREPGAAKLRNLSVLVAPDGTIRARYAKAHMFDVDIAGVAYRESDAEDPGSELVVTEVDGIPLGMTVCYDVRFPELYRLLALRGARIITVPAAFTLMTGRDHWEVLLRARAIENQCFIVAPDIIGDHGAGKVSYGHSMIIDPWGTVLARAADAECVIVADLDLGAVDRVRAAIPSLANRRADLYPITGEP
ncbi:MAG: carbon-nitrogen hydrolase family protein [Thermoleophilia bacterium]|nr:carbon-nitrogen hydrolase family protein [Thermoleophilia bacterium]MCZ4496304.1 carbon-nitrogen hydrolase family protein [Thermoleophilia bacterium]